MKNIKIAIIYDNKVRPDTTGLYFKKALESMGFSVDHYCSELYTVNSVPDEYDLHLCIDDGFDNNKPARKYNNGLTVFYAIDTHLTYGSKLNKANLYDLVFCAQKDGAEKMKKAGLDAYWIPLGMDEEIHGKLEYGKIYDLAFVGTLNVAKERLLLKEKYEKRFKTFIGKADYTDISKIYSQSKIVLNWPVSNDINMRFFEALGSGSFLLTKKVNNGEAELLREKEHYEVFNNWHDLDKKISYFLKNEDIREAIAKRGRELAVNKFTYKQRVKSMLDVISKKNEDIFHPERLALLPYCKGKGIDVGCGFRKTTPECIGVDIVARGEPGKDGCAKGRISVADIQSSGDNLSMFQDKELDFVISRHNLEHYVDCVKALQEWKRVLKKDGLLGVILPDETCLDTIRLDPTHKHVFTPESFERFLKLVGDFEIIKLETVIKNWSFLCVAKKIN